RRAPAICLAETAALKNNRPTSNIQNGKLAATKVMLMGVELCSAKYCSALYSPTLNSPSKEYRRQCVHRPLPRRNTEYPSGKRMMNAMTQRRKFSVMGGTWSLTARPTMALPAHSKGGKTSIRTVEGVSF